MFHLPGSARDMTGHGRSAVTRVRRAVVASASTLVLAAAALLVPVGPLAPAPAGAEVATLSLGAVQSLYAQDLLARVNAERSARNSGQQPVPALSVDPGLAAEAQAWSGYIASTGVVQDPALSACGPDPTAGQICELAANTGNTGNGYWPGDGSDGMDSEYMSSPGHRQNMLNAGYDEVGIGVTCSGGQAWTVEIFGYAYGDIGPAEARQATQQAIEGDPVPPGPSVAGTQTGVPIYCPGQVVGPNGQTTSTGGQYAYPYLVPPVPGEPILTPPNPAVGIAAGGAAGYWVANSDGSVQAHGSAANYGSMAGQPLVAPVTHIVGTPDGHGYWLVAADGGIFSFGDAGFHGSMGGQPLNAPVVGMAPTPDGHGYWLVASDGGIFAFGDAAFYGSMGGQPLNEPVVGMASTPDGHGYWLVASDGGIFAFGDAAFYGSMGGQPLNEPVVGMVPTPDGHGYWLVASDGGIFAFGDAPFRGSAGDLVLQAPVTGMAADDATGGYWMVGADGGVFAFDAPFEGAG
jgi:ribosomal protein L24E